MENKKNKEETKIKYTKLHSNPYFLNSLYCIENLSRYKTTSINKFTSRKEKDDNEKYFKNLNDDNKEGFLHLNSNYYNFDDEDKNNELSQFYYLTNEDEDKIKELIKNNKNNQYKNIKYNKWLIKYENNEYDIEFYLYFINYIIKNNYNKKIIKYFISDYKNTNLIKKIYILIIINKRIIYSRNMFNLYDLNNYKEIKGEVFHINSINIGLMPLYNINNNINELNWTDLNRDLLDLLIEHKIYPLELNKFINCKNEFEKLLKKLKIEDKEKYLKIENIIRGDIKKDEIKTKKIKNCKKKNLIKIDINYKKINIKEKNDSGKEDYKINIKDKIEEEEEKEEEEELEKEEEVEVEEEEEEIEDEKKIKNKKKIEKSENKKEDKKIKKNKKEDKTERELSELEKFYKERVRYVY